MNKKTIIIIVSVIAALAIIIGGTVAFLNSKFIAPKNDEQSTITSGVDANKDNNSKESASNDKTSDSSSADEDGNTSDDGGKSTSAISVPKATKDITTFIAANVTAKSGSKVKVPVYVSNNKGFMGLLAKFKYDTTALKYTGYKKGEVLTDYDVSVKDNTIGLISVENGDVKKDGIIIYLEFEVLAKASTTTPIEVIVGEGDLGNSSEKLVKSDTINGSVIVK